MRLHINDGEIRIYESVEAAQEAILYADKQHIPVWGVYEVDETGIIIRPLEVERIVRIKFSPIEAKDG